MPILATLLLTTQTLAPPAPSSQVCLTTSAATPGRRPARGTPTFSAARTLDVELRTRIRPVVNGDHLLRLKLYTPRGYLYQTFTLPFRFESADAESVDRNAERVDRNDVQRQPQATRVVPGFPRPLPVQTLGASSRGEANRADEASARLPVAGTSISLGSLFGQWTVVPYLDDGTAPCGPSGTFVIRE